MKADVVFNPIYVGLFGPGAVTVQAHGCPNPVEQFGRLGTGQSLACHLAAFLAALFSGGQEIDCKFQSNSRWAMNVLMHGF